MFVCLCACVFVCLGAWVFMCLGAWVFMCLGAWVFMCLGVWVFGYLGAWVFGDGAEIKYQIDAHLLPSYFLFFWLNSRTSAAQVPATQKQGLLAFSLWSCLKKQKI
jgi:hypothetical protein